MKLLAMNKSDLNVVNNLNNLFINFLCLKNKRSFMT
jgi:hypothetical protein